MDTRQLDNKETPQTMPFLDVKDELKVVHSHLTFTRDKVALSLVSKNFYLFFRQDLINIALYQAVIDNNISKVGNILRVNPQLLLEEPRFSIESHHTWQIFFAKKPLVMSIIRGQSEMVKLLLSLFKTLEVSGRIQNSRAEILSQWKEADHCISQQNNNLSEDILELVRVFSQIKFINDDCDPVLDLETSNCIEKFRKKLLPDEAISLEEYVDVEKILIKASEIYEQEFENFTDYRQRYLFCKLVLGFLQSLQNVELARIHCNSLYYYYNGNMKISDNAYALKLNDKKSSFYRSSRYAVSGLGYDRFCGANGYWGASNGCQLQGISELKIHVEKREAYFADEKAKVMQELEQKVTVSVGSIYRK